MPTNEEMGRYLGPHAFGDDIDPNKNNDKKERVVYVVKKDIWTSILSAAAGSVVSILLVKLLTGEKSHGSSEIETE